MAPPGGIRRLLTRRIPQREQAGPLRGDVVRMVSRTLGLIEERLPRRSSFFASGKMSNERAKPTKAFSGKIVKRVSVCTLLVALTVTGWTKEFVTTSEKFTYGGGTLGAWTGAIIGAVSGYTAAGVAVGGSVGAVAGYLIGDSLRKALESDVVKRSTGSGIDEVNAKGTEVTRR